MTETNQTNAEFIEVARDAYYNADEFTPYLGQSLDRLEAADAEIARLKKLLSESFITNTVRQP